MNGRPIQTARAAAGALVGLWLLTVFPADAANLYRYRNAQGVMVIDHTVPAHAAQSGYEILAPDGRVLETVAPSGDKTPSGEPPESAPVRTEHQEKIDRYLLSSYSTVADIEAVKARRLQEVEREIGIDKVRIEEIERQRVATEDSAADAQRGGKPVPAKLLEELKGLNQKLELARKRLAEHELQHTEIEQLYAEYTARFTELKNAHPAAAAAAAQTAPAPVPATAPASAR
ncbi:MAG: hypothetical protein AB7S51_03370 [Porticoccaceae bacterium]